MFSRDEEIRIKLAILEEKCSGRFNLESSTTSKLNDVVERMADNLEKLSDITTKNTSLLEQSQEKLRVNEKEHEEFDSRIKALLPIKIGAIIIRGMLVGAIAILVFSITNLNHLGTIFTVIQESLIRQASKTK